MATAAGLLTAKVFSQHDFAEQHRYHGLQYQHRGTDARSDPAWKADCCNNVAMTPTITSRYKTGDVSSFETAHGQNLSNDLREHSDHTEQHPDTHGQHDRPAPVLQR